MEKNISIKSDDHYENFVNDCISSGRFKNASEVIRAGLRLLEEQESKIAALRKDVADGFESGFAPNFNPKKHLDQLKSAKN